MTASSSSSLKVKVVGPDGDIRVWRLPEKGRFQQLVTFVSRKFGLEAGDFTLQFEDESDRVTMGSESDFEEGYENARQSSSTASWKIFVVPRVSHSVSSDFDMVTLPSPALKAVSADLKETETDSHAKLDSDDDDEDEEAEVALPQMSEIPQEMLASASVPSVADAAAVEVETALDKDEAPEKEEAKKKVGTDEWKVMALEFLTNEEITTLVPEFAKALILALQLKAPEKSVLEVWNELLHTDRFAPLLLHPFYEHYIAARAESVAPRIQMFIPLLASLSEESITQFVTRARVRALEAITRSLEQDSDSPANPEADCPLQMLLPPWFRCFAHDSASTCAASASASEASAAADSCCGPFGAMEEEEEVEKPKSDEHAHVKCDGCGVQPIVGSRYKCSVCPNFDLCKDCEAREDVHPKTHAMIKIYYPIDYSTHPCFIGAREVFGGRRFRRGGPCQGAVGGPRCPWLAARHDEAREPPSCGRWRGHWRHQHRRQEASAAHEQRAGVSLEGVLQSVTEALGTGARVAEIKREGNDTTVVLDIDGASLPRMKKDMTKEERKAMKLAKKRARLEARLAKCDGKLEALKTKEVEEAVSASASASAVAEPAKTSSAVKCICGGKMTKTMPAIAYSGFHAHASCDVCSAQFEPFTQMYHCFAESTKHSHGYDLCETCFQGQQVKEPLPEKVVDCASAPASASSAPSAPASTECLPKVACVEEEKAVVEHDEEEDEDDSSSQSPPSEAEAEIIASAPSLVIPAVPATLPPPLPATRAPVPDYWTGFEYAHSGRTLESLGFTGNREFIKSLLVAHKGNVEVVANLLLG